MNSNNSRNANKNAASFTIDDEPPLWNYVEKKNKTGRGGNCVFICSFCKQEKQGTYTRVKAHLLEKASLHVTRLRNIKCMNCSNLRRIMFKLGYLQRR